MKKFIKDFFSFSKTERNGVFVLLGLILVLIIGRQFISLFYSYLPEDYSAFFNEVKAFEAAQGRLDSVRSSVSVSRPFFDYSRPDEAAKISRLHPFPFDPNIMTEADWKQLGLNPGQIRTLMNYKSKGGAYRAKNDFKKMYCISAEEYNELEPFLLLPEKANNSGFKAGGEKLKNQYSIDEPIDINTATAEELTKLKGIGNFFADKIIQYRQRLGGYLNKEQLLEISKMDTARYLAIEPYIFANTNAIRRINVNEADFETLSRHPYIGKNIARSLISYREQHGLYAELGDIRKSALVTDEVYKKISPYLKTE